MMDWQKVSTRVLRRLGRVKGCERVALVAEDRLDHLTFLADVRRYRGAQERFKSISSRAEHLRFANDHFGSHQIEAEILGLLDWIAGRKPRVVCEIGTAMGGTSYLLSQSLPTVQHF